MTPIGNPLWWDDYSRFMRVDKEKSRIAFAIVEEWCSNQLLIRPTQVFTAKNLVHDNISVCCYHSNETSCSNSDQPLYRLAISNWHRSLDFLSFVSSQKKNHCNWSEKSLRYRLHQIRQPKTGGWFIVEWYKESTLLFFSPDWKDALSSFLFLKMNTTIGANSLPILLATIVIRFFLVWPDEKKMFGHFQRNDSRVDIVLYITKSFLPNSIGRSHSHYGLQSKIWRFTERNSARMFQILECFSFISSIGVSKLMNVDYWLQLTLQH